MSGGHFDYIQYEISRVADQVDQYIRRCESDAPNEYEWRPDYKPETLEKFRECEQVLRRAAAMLQRVDWLASGDDGEDSFHERWEEEMGKL